MTTTALPKSQVTLGGPGIAYNLTSERFVTTHQKKPIFQPADRARGNKNEKWTSPADHHDTSGQFDPTVHSSSGKTFVSLPGFAQEIDGMVIQATSQLLQEFSFNLDTNSGRPLGLGKNWYIFDLIVLNNQM